MKRLGKEKKKKGLYFIVWNLTFKLDRKGLSQYVRGEKKKKAIQIHYPVSHYLHMLVKNH